MMPGPFEAAAGVLPPGALLPGAVPDATPAAAATTEGVVQPTKLFIGGISRRTTTKQLRDHFSKSGRVLDCVAMRTPDGRPRGFGYVTLDSPAAAQRFLSEPQMIDDRIVDMKRAVPESQTPKNAGTPVGLCSVGYGPDAEMFHHPGMFYGNTMSPWPEEQAGLYLDPGFYGMGLPDVNPLAQSGLEQQLGMPDCVDLLTAGCLGGLLGALPGVVFPDPSEYQVSSPLSTVPPVTGGPLSEVTNVISAGGSQRSSPTAAAAAGGNKWSKSMQSASFAFPPGELTKPYQPSLLDTSVSPTSGEVEECFVYEDDAAQQQDAPKKEEPSLTCMPCTATETNEEKEPTFSSAATVGSEDEESEGEDGEEGEATFAEWKEGDPLPSLGSALHAAGECRRCNFFAKGRCRNGQDCTFCHLPHERRKLSRQEKRDQQAARLLQQDGGVEQATESAAEGLQTGPLLSPVLNVGTPAATILRPGLVLPPQLTFLESASSARGAASEPSPEATPSAADGSTPASLPPGLRPPGLPPPPATATPSTPSVLAAALLPTPSNAGSWGNTPLFATTPSGPLLSTAPPSSLAQPLQKKEVKETATVATQTDEDLGCAYCDCCDSECCGEVSLKDLDDANFPRLDSDDKAQKGKSARRRRATASAAAVAAARAKAAAVGGS